MAGDSLNGFPSAREGHWPSTMWEFVRAARDGTTQEQKQALDRLVMDYYKPVYRFYERVMPELVGQAGRLAEVHERTQESICAPSLRRRFMAVNEDRIHRSG